MEFLQVDSAHFNQAKKLIKKADLPISDLIPSDKLLLFMAKQNETLLGVCGLEQYKTEAILRSFVVSEYSRNKGIGKAIYQFTISKAAELGIKSLVLLTTTADTWFKKHHWNVIDRNTVSQSLAESAEFNSICPQCHLHAT